MKKAKPNSTTSPPQPEHKPDEAKPVHDNHYPLREEVRAAYRLPSVFELAQIAAALNSNENWRDFVPHGLGDWKEESVAKSALGLWQQCQDVILTALLVEQGEISDREAKKKANLSEWETALRKIKFPLEFERGLKLIVGEKTRRADRHKMFRLFLYDSHGNWIKKKSALGFDADETFTALKADGFENLDLRNGAACFSEWRKKQTKAKARRAAEKRWASQKK